MAGYTYEIAIGPKRPGEDPSTYVMTFHPSNSSLHYHEDEPTPHFIIMKMKVSSLHFMKMKAMINYRPIGSLPPNLRATGVRP